MGDAREGVLAEGGGWLQGLGRPPGMALAATAWCLRLDMLDRMATLNEQLGELLAMAVCDELLGAHQAERLWDAIELLEQRRALLPQEFRIVSPPV